MNQINNSMVDDGNIWAKQFLLAMQTISPVGIFCTDAVGQCTFVNHRWCQITGISHDEALLTGWERALHIDDKERVAAAWYESARANLPFQSEYRFVHPDGTVVWVFGQAVADTSENGDVIGYAGAITDISDQKLSERRIRELASIVESTDDAILSTDFDGRIEHWNAAAERMFGYSPLEAEGRHISLLTTVDQRPEQTRIFDTIKRQGKISNLKTVRFARGGRPVDVSLTVSALTDNSGEITGFSAIIRDIGAQKRAEEQLHEKEAQLAHVGRVHTMNELIAGIAHEISQPLAAISNFSAACSMTLEKSDHARRKQLLNWTEQISKQVLKCGEIITRLRDFVRKDEGDLKLVDMNAVITESVALIDADHSFRTTRVNCELTNSECNVNAIQVQLQQVVVNLVRNAFDAVSVCGDREPLIQVRSTVSGDKVELSVHDNGIGIEDNDLARVFDPFFTTKPGGLGVGLAISKSIASNHGGRIWAEADALGGSTFHLQLPLARTEELECQPHRLSS